jgi:hypothetical protein
VSAPASASAFSSPYSSASAPSDPSTSSSTIERIEPPEYGFYGKKLVFQGIAIKAHSVVSDDAMLIARDRLSTMLAALPAVVDNLASIGSELHIIGAQQVPSDLPENFYLKGKPFSGDLTIDERTRGTGGFYASCGEENLLKYERNAAVPDRYEGRDICVHEFAHTILNFGVDDATRGAFVERHTKASPLWATTYADKNEDEFFAELSMWYFGTHGDAGQLTGVKPGPEWLREHDPDSFAMFERFYGGRMPVAKLAWTKTPVLPASAEATTRSGPNGPRVRLAFRNETDAPYELFWLDFQGRRKSYGMVRPHATAIQHTFASHAWVYVDGQSVARGVVVARSGAEMVVIR